MFAPSRSPHRLLVLLGIAFTVLPRALAGQATESATGQDTLLWSHSTVEKISFYRVTETGDLLVTTKEDVSLLDPTTGEAIWTRDDIRELKLEAFDLIPLTRYGVIRSKNGIAVIDLATGSTMWDSTTVPLKKVRGYFAVPGRNMMLIYGESEESNKTLVATDLLSGELRWAQPELFDKKPPLEENEGIHTLAGHQAPIFDTDSTMILPISKDGPIQIHVETGELIWWAEALKGKDPPTFTEWYAPMLLTDGMLLVPYDKKLMAISVADGSMIWDREENFKSPIAQMELHPQGLILRGMRPLDQKTRLSMPDAFLDLVDPASGQSLWIEPFEEMKDESTAPFLVIDDAVYLGDKEKFYTVDMTDGSWGEPIEYKFEGGEEPSVIEWRTDDFMLLSQHNLMLLDTLGVPKQHGYFKAPGSSLLSKIGTGLFIAAAVVASAAADDGSVPMVERVERQISLAAEADRYVYMYTSKPDSSGREGFSLVRVAKNTGHEAGRLWLEERSADYEVDEFSGIIYCKVNDREIVALRYRDE